jgi:ribosomal protein S16
LTKVAHSRLSDLGFAEQADEFWPLIGHADPSPKEVIVTNEPTPTAPRSTATLNSDRAKEILSQSSALSEKVEEILLN